MPAMLLPPALQPAYAKNADTVSRANYHTRRFSAHVDNTLFYLTFRPDVITHPDEDHGISSKDISLWKK